MHTAAPTDTWRHVRPRERVAGRNAGDGMPQEGPQRGALFLLVVLLFDGREHGRIGQGGGIAEDLAFGDIAQ